MNSDKKGLHCLVSGHVQGVAYRAETQKKAQSLGLTGWASNLPDGQVEVYVFGPHDTVTVLLDWLWEGSPAARVEHVEYNEIPWQHHSHFTTR